MPFGVVAEPVAEISSTKPTVRDRGSALAFELSASMGTFSDISDASDLLAFLLRFFSLCFSLRVFLLGFASDGDVCPDIGLPKSRPTGIPASLSPSSPLKISGRTTLGRREVESKYDCVGSTVGELTWEGRDGVSTELALDFLRPFLKYRLIFFAVFTDPEVVSLSVVLESEELDELEVSIRS